MSEREPELHEAGAIDELFDRLAELAGDARAEALAELARRSPAAARDVASLLHAHDSDGALDQLLTRLADGDRQKETAHGQLSGKRVRQYAVGELIGRGGMGDVYRARDTRLNRDVALKCLPEWLGRDPAAKERFLTEARIISALDHTNVCTLYEANETESGQLFLVMPFYEGETLRSRLTRGRLPEEQAVDVALQVARGLSAAHEQGVIHRDVKPANLMLTSADRVVILDFGVAKLTDVSLTSPGQNPGTMRYMAPEQAAGDRVDGRADLYSLGLVLHEMLTGRLPGMGEDDSLAGVSEPLAQLVESLISRDPDSRPRDADAVAAELEELCTDVPSHPRRRRRPIGGISARAGMVGVTLAIVAGAAVVLGLMSARGPESLALGAATRTLWQRGLAIEPAISPDGRHVAYAAGSPNGTRVLITAVDGGAPTPLTDDSVASQSSPSWSPDGERVLYLSVGDVWSAPVRGGEPRREAQSRGGAGISAADWAPDGERIAFVARDSLFIRRADGVIRFVAPTDRANSCNWSPDGARIACAVGNKWYALPGPQFNNQAASSIVVFDVATGAHRDITGNESLNQAPAWSANGRTIFFVSNRNGPLDLYAATVEGDIAIRRVTTGLGVHWFSLTADGKRLIYSLLRDAGNIWYLPNGPLPLDQRDAVQVTHGSVSIEGFDVSADDSFIIYSADVGGNGDIFRIETEGGVPERLTDDPAGDFSPDLSPDETMFAFQSWRRGTRDIFVKPVDGGAAELILDTPNEEAMPRWSPDGSTITAGYFSDELRALVIRRSSDGEWAVTREIPGVAYVDWSPDGESLTMVDGLFGGHLLRAGADSGPVVPALPANGPTFDAVSVSGFSSDGRYVYFMNHQAPAAVWRIPASGGESELVVKFDDPNHPVFRVYWDLTDRRLYYVAQDLESEIWAVDVVGSSE